MEIKQHCVVGLTWTLKDTMGETLDVLEEPVEFLVGGADLLGVIEEALQGHAPGDKIDLHIEPEQGFGDFNDQLIFLEPRQLFPDDMEEGMTFEGASLPPGCNATQLCRSEINTPPGIMNSSGRLFATPATWLIVTFGFSCFCNLSCRLISATFTNSRSSSSVKGFWT